MHSRSSRRTKELAQRLGGKVLVGVALGPCALLGGRCLAAAALARDLGGRAQHCREARRAWALEGAPGHPWQERRGRATARAHP